MHPDTRAGTRATGASREESGRTASHDTTGTSRQGSKSRTYSTAAADGSRLVAPLSRGLLVALSTGLDGDEGEDQGVLSAAATTLAIEQSHERLHNREIRPAQQPGDPMVRGVLEELQTGRSKAHHAF